jgi:diacylglycerol O-acyltransferase / wax synthase
VKSAFVVIERQNTPVTPEPLSAEDARILALESGTIRGHTCKVIVLEGEHGAEDVCAQLGPRLDLQPRLRQRVEDGRHGPEWVDDPGFAVERHVRARGPADRGELLELVGETMAEPLDRRRPLWAMDVVSPLGERDTAIVWRIHHAMADGSTAMRMLRDLLLEPAEEAARPPRRAAPPARAPASTALPAVLRRELARRGAPSVLDRPAGPRREVAFLDASLEELRAIGHAAPERATVNDVVLTAVAGGLRDWLELLGAPEQGLRLKVPVSLHHLEEAPAANRDSFMFVDLPLAEPDPVARLVAVARETRERKLCHDAETLDRFFRDLSHLSHSLERFAQHWAMSPRVFTLNVSNVPGPAGPQRALGSALLELHSLAEIAHRHALRVAVVSAAGRISFGLCADPDAVGDLGVIARGIERELEALGAAL